MSQRRWVLVQGAFASLITTILMWMFVYLLFLVVVPQIAAQTACVVAAFVFICAISATYRMAARHKERDEESIATIIRRKNLQAERIREIQEEQDKGAKEKIIRSDNGYLDEEGFHLGAPPNDRGKKS